MAGALASALVYFGERTDGRAWVLVALACVALLAERQSVRLTSHTEVSVSALPILFAAVVYGPLDGMIVGAGALLGEFRRPLTRWVVWTSSRALVGGFAGIAAVLVREGDNSFGLLFIAVTIAAVIEGLVDSVLVSLTATLRGNSTFRRMMKVMSRLVLATVPLHASVVAVLAYAYLEVSKWTVLFFLVPALASQRFLFLYQEQRRLTEDLLAANARLERATLSFASGLVTTLDARDRYTAGHSAAVAVYSRDIAEQLRLSSEEQQSAHLSGLLHDIGKVGLSPTILDKKGPLTDSERLQMEEHATIGERILANVENYDAIAHVVRHHHERWDGNGYPDGLACDQIPVISRIIAVADAYNAMTSERPYRNALSSSIARARLREAAGSQFDPSVVSAFERVLSSATESYLRGARADFSVEAQRHPSFSGDFVSPAAA